MKYVLMLACSISRSSTGIPVQHRDYVETKNFAESPVLDQWLSACPACGPSRFMGHLEGIGGSQGHVREKHTGVLWFFPENLILGGGDFFLGGFGDRD
eukprot:1362028-Amorphochlora_amoeboformis.AAC.1